MTNTERREKPISQEGEMQTRIPCKERSAPDVMADLSHALADAEAKNRDPLIVLEDLGQLRGSVMTLMKGLSRALVAYPRTVTFWEASGYAEAFLSVMEARNDGP